MNKEIGKIKKLHSEIERGLFYRDSDLSYEEVIDRISDLSNSILEYPGEAEDWLYIGETSAATPDSIIVGAFWHLTEWHGGQSSNSYAALCSCGAVFSPGMTSGPEPESADMDVYEALETMAEQE